MLGRANTAAVWYGCSVACLWHGMAEVWHGCSVACLWRGMAEVWHAVWLFTLGVIRSQDCSFLWGSALLRLTHPPKLPCASCGEKGGRELGEGLLFHKQIIVVKRNVFGVSVQVRIPVTPPAHCVTLSELIYLSEL